MDSLESRITEWRREVERGPALDSSDVDELEGHLRDQISDLSEVGLAPDEAFLIAVKRIGALDPLADEFAREHGDRLWKQLVLAPATPADSTGSGWAEPVTFALLAAIAIQVPRLWGWGGSLASGSEDALPYLRNLSLLVLPFLAAYLVRSRKLGWPETLVAALPFVILAIVVNAYPWTSNSDSEIIAIIHLPVVLWFGIAYPYMGGTWGSHRKRMDFIRFSGEWFIYYSLIALGGGVLLGLTAAILQPAGPDVVEGIFEWVLPSGAAGAVIIAAWLVDSKKSVVENMAPVLTKVFTPLFAIALTASVIVYVLAGLGDEFNRELFFVFDIMLVVVLGLVLYGLSARDSDAPVGWADRILVVTLASALALDLIVLASMLIRVGDLGWTPNRVAVIGLNLVLLVNLVWAAWLSARLIVGKAEVSSLELWQTTYLPVFGIWAAVVVVALPPLFSFG